MGARRRQASSVGKLGQGIVEFVTQSVVWTSVFADGAGGGSPCPVVFHADGWPDEELQAAAARFGVETVFVLAPRSGGDVRLRYFVPVHEIEMCVHAPSPRASS